MSADSALSSTHWLLQEGAPAYPHLPPLPGALGWARLELDRSLASDFPGSRRRARLGRTVSSCHRWETGLERYSEWSQVTQDVGAMLRGEPLCSAS